MVPRVGNGLEGPLSLFPLRAPTTLDHSAPQALPASSLLTAETFRMPAHPLTSSLNEQGSLHLLASPIHPGSSCYLSLEQGPPGAPLLWTAVPVDHRMLRLDWESLDAWILSQALHWRETHEIFFELQKTSPCLWIYVGLSKKYPHWWESRLFLRIPKQGHFTHFLWNFSQHLVTLSSNNIHPSALY